MKYNQILLSLAFITLWFILPSCSTSTKVIVKQRPGSFVPLVETCGQNKDNTWENVKCKLPDGAYFGLQLAFNPETGQMYPFAIDYKRRSVKNFTTMWTISWITFPATLGIWPLCEGWRGGQFCYAHKIKYLPFQNTNTDLYVAPLDIEYYDEDGLSGTNTSQPVYTRWNVDNAPTEATAQPVASQPVRPAPAAQPEVTQNARPRRNHAVADAATRAVGDYVTFGYLSSGANQSEQLANVTVHVARVDANTVKVNVIEGNQDFFGSSATYTVTVDGSGKTTLTHSDIPTAIILIGADGSINYLHPRVNIDGTLYTLMLSGNKN